MKRMVIEGEIDVLNVSKHSTYMIHKTPFLFVSIGNRTNRNEENNGCPTTTT